MQVNESDLALGIIIVSSMILIVVWKLSPIIAWLGNKLRRK